MKTYRSPVYPALTMKLPEAGKSVKASGGYFNVDDENVEEFESLIAKRRHYRIVPVEENPKVIDAPVESIPTTAADGIVVQPEPISESERHPENVQVESLEQLKVPELKERLEALGLSTEGLKNDLIERLAAATDVPDGQQDGPEAE